MDGILALIPVGLGDWCVSFHGYEETRCERGVALFGETRCALCVRI